MKKEILIPIIIIIIIVPLAFYTGVKLEIFKEERPECYITYNHEPIDLKPQIACMNGYKEIGLEIRLEQADFIQCCRKPHYLLQGYHKELIEDAIKVCVDSTNDDIRDLPYLNTQNQNKKNEVSKSD